MPTIAKKAVRAIAPTIVAAACVLGVLFVVNKIVDLARGTPHVGDILAFVPSTTEPGESGTRLLVHRRNQFGCVLDLNVIRRSGGSLIVETEAGGGAGNFRVHWAGDRTSAGTENCGIDADLIVDRSDLNILALSAGGYGVAPKPMPVLTGDIGN